MDGSREGYLKSTFVAKDPGEAMNLAKQMLHREDFFGGRMDDFQLWGGVFFRVLSPRKCPSRLMVLQKKTTHLDKTSRTKKVREDFSGFFVWSNHVHDLKQSPEEPYPENPHPFLV